MFLSPNGAGRRSSSSTLFESRDFWPDPVIGVAPKAGEHVHVYPLIQKRNPKKNRSAITRWAFIYFARGAQRVS